jgi:uncharacterized protein (TIGR02996 family)
MTDGHALLQALCEAPTDGVAWRALADWLEESGQPDRAELLRLDLSLREGGTTGRSRREKRLQRLLASGVRPCVPSVLSSVGMVFALVPAGAFLMGSLFTERDRGLDEGPPHRVTLPRAFFLGTCPVTQGQYEWVIGANPSWHTAAGWDELEVPVDTRDFPVEGVSWEDAIAFCDKLSGLPEEKEAGRSYRLPTEAEWEYACRAGTTTPFAFGDALSSRQANFNGRFPYGRAPQGPCLRRPSAVGSYGPNAWGLYDMHGNVYEWCSDWFDSYAGSSQTAPQGPGAGEHRVQRGGCWFSSSAGCRSAARARDEPGNSAGSVGFRVCLTVAWPTTTWPVFLARS